MSLTKRTAAQQSAERNRCQAANIRTRKKRRQAPDAPLKAYAAVDGDEAGCIVFARNGAEARRYAANEMGCEFGEVEYCVREPSLDVFAGKDIPVQAVLGLGGWWCECRNCGCRIVDRPRGDWPGWIGAYEGELICDNPTHMANPMLPVGVWPSGAWCSQGCWEQDSR